MGPLEGFFLAVAFIIMLIGLARGYRRELGNTVVLMGTILLLAFVYQYGARFITQMRTAFDAASADLLMCTTLTIGFIVVVFASYSGRTFDFTGKEIVPPGGSIISILIGLTNGYLIAGTLWFLQAIFNYPIQRIFSWFVPTNTSAVQTLIDNGQAVYWPPVLFPSPVFWAIPIVILLILRVRGYNNSSGAYSVTLGAQ